MILLEYDPSIFHDYHCPILRNSFPPVSGMHQSSPAVAEFFTSRIQEFWMQQYQYRNQQNFVSIGIVS